MLFQRNSYTKLYRSDTGQSTQKLIPSTAWTINLPLRLFTWTLPDMVRESCVLLSMGDLTRMQVPYYNSVPQWVYGRTVKVLNSHCSTPSPNREENWSDEFTLIAYVWDIVRCVSSLPRQNSLIQARVLFCRKGCEVPTSRARRWSVWDWVYHYELSPNSWGVIHRLAAIGWRAALYPR